MIRVYSYSVNLHQRRATKPRDLQRLNGEDVTSSEGGESEGEESVSLNGSEERGP